MNWLRIKALAYLRNAHPTYMAFPMDELEMVEQFFFANVKYGNGVN